MLWTFFFAFVLIFPVFRLGFFGVTLYNIFRVFVGSMAYPLIFAIYVYLFGFKWLRKHSNYCHRILDGLRGALCWSFTPISLD